MDKVYLVVIVPNTSLEAAPNIRFITRHIPTKEGILHFLQEPKGNHVFYLGGAPAQDVLTTDGIINEFAHLSAELIPAIESNPFPTLIEGVQRVGYNFLTSVQSPGWIEIQTIPLTNLAPTTTGITEWKP